jgi:hypothetical protein
MMLDAYGQDVLARCGFKALNGHPYDPVFQKEAGFLFLMTTGLKGGGRVIHNSRCDPNPSSFWPWLVYRFLIRKPL